MTFVLMIAREGRMNVRHGWQIRRRRSDDLDARLLVRKETIAADFADLFDLAAAFFRTWTSR